MEREPLVPRKYLAAIAVISSTILEIIDTSVVNVSLPHIAGNLSATIPEATWVITSYIAANAMVLPLTGWLTNFFGRQRILLIVVTGFVVSSVLCGMAPTLPLLVFFRILQGITGGGLQPLSLSVLYQEFPQGERAQATAIWGVGVVVAPMVGPTLGGWITENYSWRWIFYVNVPFGIISLIMIWMFISDSPRDRSKKIDAWGIGLLALGMAALQVMLDKGQEDDWFSSHFIVALVALAAIALPLFVMRELMIEDPVVRLRLFKDRNFAFGSSVATVMYFVLYGSLILMPLFMQTILGWSPMTAGIWTSPRGLGSAVGMMMQWHPWFKRANGRTLIIGGFAATSFIFFAYAGMNLDSGTHDVMLPQFFQGLMVSLAFVPLNTMSLAFIGKKDMPYATSIYSTLRNIGSSMGISFVAFFLERRKEFHRVVLSEHISTGSPATLAYIDRLASHFHMQGGFDLSTAKLQSLIVLNRIVLLQASLASYLDAFKLLGILFLAVLPLTFFMRRAQPKGR